MRNGRAKEWRMKASYEELRVRCIGGSGDEKRCDTDEIVIGFFQYGCVASLVDSFGRSVLSPTIHSHAHTSIANKHPSTAADTHLKMATAHHTEPWSPTITNYLLEVDHGALEQEYYGPFNTMLTHVFPFAEHYTVVPQSYPNPREAVGYLIEFMLLVNNKIVGGAEIKRESDIDDDNARRAAHQQVLNRFRTMHDLVRVPVLVLISAIGRHCRVYRYTRATRRAVPALTAGLARDQWDIDLTTPQGRWRLDEVFIEIKHNAHTTMQPD